ncbi:alpha/beta fold hydrolase [Microbacterium sp. SSM24]|uniref:alpha/beta fold hydrolase n=1 Tax=Microbacterium sp. SSM24 TaxID=2991714 RepID=UPI00222806B7|nr:alpha/beta hydrolase [Microbacterium sp. SSM24]MCW3492683.1 alpha/beta hydrolase [Microbacterium sp. SSM24]
MTEKSFTTTDGAVLRYLDEGAGRTVVLVHGLGCNRAHWEFQRQPLVDAGFRVIIPDLRLHGESDRPAFGHRVSRLGQDLSELMDAENLTEVALIGHSLGVSVALAYVSLAGTRRLSHFVAIDQTPRIVNDASWEWGVREVRWEALEDQLAGRTPWGDPGREPAMPAEVAEMVSAAGAFQSFTEEPLRRLALDHFVSDWRDAVTLLDVPTWVVTGALSPSFPVESMHWFADSARHGTLSIYPSSGHCPHWNEHREFNDDLIGFLAA